MGFLITKTKYFIKKEGYAGGDFLQERINTEISKDELESIVRMYKYVKSNEKSMPEEMTSLVNKVKEILK